MKLSLIAAAMVGLCACWQSEAAPSADEATVKWSELWENPVGRMLSPAPAAGKIQDAMAKPAGKKQKIYLIMPPFVKEGGEPGVVTLKLAYPEKVSVKFVVTAFPKGLVTAPASVVMGTGRTSVSFNFTVKDDEVTSLNRLAGIRLTVDEVGFSITNSTRIFDDEEPPGATMTLPAGFREGDATEQEATLTLDRPLAKDGFVDLVQSPRDQLSMPGQVLIRAGQTRVTFPISVIDDARIEGDAKVLLSAQAGTRKLAKGRVNVLDNESRQLTLALPATVSEGDKATGTVGISGTLRNDLVVALSDGTAAALSLPGSVTIPAGETSATFKIGCPENMLRDGSRKVIVSAQAGKFTGASRQVVVLDDDVGSYRISGFARILDPRLPLKITVSAVDVEGKVIAGFSGRVDLSAVLSGGSRLAVKPSFAILSAGSWTGRVTLPATSTLITGLAAADGTGVVGGTVDFDTVRTLQLIAADMVWDAARQRIYASMPNGATHQVVAIDPRTLQITGGIATGQKPGKLALTGGGEYLYVSLAGNGTIAKIDPGSMTAVTTFAVGGDELTGPLYAADLAAVPGQPDLIIATRYPIGAGGTNSVAVYDNGIARGVATPVRSGSSLLQPSADPTVFFDFNIQFVNQSRNDTRRLLKLDENGISELAGTQRIRGLLSFGERTGGDTVFFPDGDAYEGLEMKPLGNLSTGGTVCPDVAANRVFYIEREDDGNVGTARIAVYDPVSRNLIRSLQMPRVVEAPSDFIRWGSNGLAYQTSAGLTLVHSPRLVAGDPAADLLTTVKADRNPANVGAPVTFTVTVKNQGPNIARQAFLATRFSGSVTIKDAISTKGLPAVGGADVNMPMGELAVGMTATLKVTVVSTEKGSASCTAQASSNAADPDFSNSAAFRMVNFGYRTETDALNKVGLAACSQIHDPTRDLIWLAIPAYSSFYPPYYDITKRNVAPLCRAVVSLNPRTGEISDPIALHGDPVENSLGLSGNGRYLYVGLREVGEVSRIDLDASPPQVTRIPLPPGEYGFPYDGGDIEVLDGDGTSILLATSSGESVMVIDGTIPRPVRIHRNSGTYANTVGRIVRTSNPALFTGYSGNNLYLLSLASDGVRITKSRIQPDGVFPGTRGDGETWLWGTSLMDVNTLAHRINLLPWSYSWSSFLDAPNQRAYILDKTLIRGFNTGSGFAVGTFKIADYDWEIADRSMMRWGSDGFSILNYDGILIARWSLAAPSVSSSRMSSLTGGKGADPAKDSDGDGIPNAFEQFFATSPSRFNPNPIMLTTATAGEKTVIHLTFPRRVGITMPSYGYEFSRDLATWEPVEDVFETILSTQTVDGVEVEIMDAAIVAPAIGNGFVRLRWQ